MEKATKPNIVAIEKEAGKISKKRRSMGSKVGIYNQIKYITMVVLPYKVKSPHRLAVRTALFQGVNTGSTPVGGASFAVSTTHSTADFLIN